MTSAQKKQVGSILMILFLGVFTGLMMVVGLLVVYSPPETISAKNSLLSADVIESFSEEGHGSFTFDHIEYFYHKEGDVSWSGHEVTIPEYKQFYRLVQGDKGSVTEGENFGDVGARLVIFGREKNARSTPFQEIQFSEDGNHFRVQMKTPESKSKWVTYTHEDIQALTEKIVLDE